MGQVMVNSKQRISNDDLISLIPELEQLLKKLLGVADVTVMIGLNESEDENTGD